MVKCYDTIDELRSKAVVCLETWREEYRALEQGCTLCVANSAMPPHVALSRIAELEALVRAIDDIQGTSPHVAERHLVESGVL